jgi:predicted GIY-YIG superfamily endonuclease
MKKYHQYFVYIVTNKHKTVLYTGVTNNIFRRKGEHEQNALQGKKKLLQVDITLIIWCILKNISTF